MYSYICTCMYRFLVILTKQLSHKKYFKTKRGTNLLVHILQSSNFTKVNFTENTQSANIIVLRICNAPRFYWEAYMYFEEGIPCDTLNFLLWKLSLNGKVIFSISTLDDRSINTPTLFVRRCKTERPSWSTSSSPQGQDWKTFQNFIFLQNCH